jgi:hypothetical protein
MILEVAVHHGDPRPARVMEPGRDRRVLPEVATQENAPHRAVQLGQALYLRPRAVFGAIVDQNNLIARVHAAQCGGESFVQVSQAGLTAVHGYDDAEHGIESHPRALAFNGGLADPIVSQLHRATIPPARACA